VCVQEHERYYPTPPHPTPAVIRMFRNLTAASDRFITSDKSFTAASDAVLLPQVTGKSHCRKWSKLTAASEVEPELSQMTICFLLFPMKSYWIPENHGFSTVKSHGIQVPLSPGLSDSGSQQWRWILGDIRV
jgi:hypothetical protein